MTEALNKDKISFDSIVVTTVECDKGFIADVKIITDNGDKLGEMHIEQSNYIADALKSLRLHRLEGVVVSASDIAKDEEDIKNMYHLWEMEKKNDMTNTASLSDITNNRNISPSKLEAKVKSSQPSPAQRPSIELQFDNNNNIFRRGGPSFRDIDYKPMVFTGKTVHLSGKFPGFGGGEDSFCGVKEGKPRAEKIITECGGKITSNANKMPTLLLLVKKQVKGK